MGLGAIVMEPFGRNTAACGMIAARLGQEASGAKAVLMIPSDHHIAKPSVFVDIVHQATPLTEEGYLVTFGINRPIHTLDLAISNAEMRAVPDILFINSTKNRLLKPQRSICIAVPFSGTLAYSCLTRSRSWRSSISKRQT